MESNASTIEFLQRKLTEQSLREIPTAGLAGGTSFLVAANKGGIAPSMPLSTTSMTALRKLEGSDFGAPNYLASSWATKNLLPGSALGAGGPMSSVAWKT
eukprot:3311009-Amphidinium_carterae.1